MADDRRPLPALPGSAAEVVVDTPLLERHPGLQLDKYLPSVEVLGGVATPRAGLGDQEVQKAFLVDVCRAGKDPEFGNLLARLIERRQRVLDGVSAVRWSSETAGPLTLHLARASVLENAGICLHPVYGFPLLPGSGLKGMARAFAETVWLPAQNDPKGAWRRVEDVFGWAPSPERRRRIADPDHPAERRREADADPESAEMAASGGTVVFHDAWPEAWPTLRLDILSNHHRRYYEDEDEPGDWEGPNLVYFLAIGAGERFLFALSKRRPDLPDELVALARKWLTGAIAHLGAGAKTAAGYGVFRAPDGAGTALASPAVRTSETELELVTSAFLAGANQSADDCDLRPATLRGLLRWWWRTMHVGFVDPPTLCRLEAAVWGDTKAGGPVRVTVEGVDVPKPVLFAFKRGSQPAEEFRGAHGLRSPRQAGAAEEKKTSWGLFYHSYGMDEKGRGRYFVEAGARWRVRLTARRGSYRAGWNAASNSTGDGRTAKQTALDPGLVLSQAQAALWLLCRFGGVGSKGRKGFGSLADVEVEGIRGLDDCRRLGREFRAACGLGDQVFSAGLAASPSLEQVIALPDIPTSWADPWFALNEVGYSAQDFAQEHKDDGSKLALGLPRMLKRLGALEGPKGKRHASPVLYHLARAASGALVVRVVVFPARHLPDLEKSTAFLKRLLAHLEVDLRERARRVGDGGPRPAGGPLRRPLAAPERGAAAAPVAKPDRPVPTPKPGDHVQAILLEEKTRKGGWKARHVPSGLVGEIQNTKDIPTGRNAGEVVTLLIAYIQPRAIAFLWPTPEQEERARKSREGSTDRPRPGGSNRGRRPR